MLPALLVTMPSLAPQTALGTNKSAAIAGTAAAVVTFSRRVPMRWRVLVPAAAIAAVTSAAGASIVAFIDKSLFIPIVMVVLVGVAVFVTLRPQVGMVLATHPPSRRRFALVVGIVAGLLGFYDGLLGPGTGTFLIIAFATLLGTDFVRSAAMAKVINLGSNFGALVYFASTGHVLWSLGLAMAGLNIAGSVVGSRMALRRGAGFVRIVLLVVVVVMVIRLGWQEFG